MTVVVNTAHTNKKEKERKNRVREELDNGHSPRAGLYLRNGKKGHVGRHEGEEERTVGQEGRRQARRGRKEANKERNRRNTGQEGFADTHARSRPTPSTAMYQQVSKHSLQQEGRRNRRRRGLIAGKRRLFTQQ
mmetsp:Transcript_26552/g.52140  ORF Transcript_26552/g.52140 Transcript_26552/m.52140 type:complete len:134 (+) Transcript_26552:911-1312(+)